jgi:hypothetical protein
MASLLRQIVAGPRVKHAETGLDLCYVTENIIATYVPCFSFSPSLIRNLILIWAWQISFPSVPQPLPPPSWKLSPTFSNLINFPKGTDIKTLTPTTTAPAPRKPTRNAPTATPSTPATATAGRYGSSAPKARATRTRPSMAGFGTTRSPTITRRRSGWSPGLWAA